MPSSPISFSARKDTSGSDSARVFTEGSKLVESQATDNSANTGQIGGVKVGDRSSLTTNDNSTTTITNTDAAVANQAITAVADVSKQFGAQLKDYLTTTGTQSNQQLTTALSSIGTLAQGQQQQVADNSASADTSGASRFIKPALIALAIIAAVIVWTKKK
jgi:hypothetical protein